MPAIAGYDDQSGEQMGQTRWFGRVCVEGPGLDSRCRRSYYFFHLFGRTVLRRDNEMLKTIFVILLTTLSASVLGQTSTTPQPTLEEVQQWARYAREQLKDAELKAQAAEKNDKLAKKRFEEAKAQADQSAKELENVQAQLTKAKERHDRAYQELKRTHDALEARKQQ